MSQLLRARENHLREFHQPNGQKMEFHLCLISKFTGLLEQTIGLSDLLLDESSI